MRTCGHLEGWSDSETKRCRLLRSTRRPSTLSDAESLFGIETMATATTSCSTSCGQLKAMTWCRCDACQRQGRRCWRVDESACEGKQCSLRMRVSDTARVQVGATCMYALHCLHAAPARDVGQHESQPAYGSAVCNAEFERVRERTSRTNGCRTTTSST
eukprot:3402542-Rhodomonas_salina.4